MRKIIACSRFNVRQPKYNSELRREREKEEEGGCEKGADERANEFVFYNFPTTTMSDERRAGCNGERGKIGTYAE